MTKQDFLRECYNEMVKARPFILQTHTAEGEYDPSKPDYSFTHYYGPYTFEQWSTSQIAQAVATAWENAHKKNGMVSV